MQEQRTRGESGVVPSGVSATTPGQPTQPTAAADQAPAAAEDAPSSDGKDRAEEPSYVSHRPLILSPLTRFSDTKDL